MIKQLFFFTFILMSFIGVSQCDVNTQQAPFLADPAGSYDMQIIDNELSLEPFNASYDTLTAFPTALEGSVWDAVVGVRIPNDTSFVYDLGSGPQLFEDVQINSIGINSVIVTESTNGNLSLPTGFSWDCVGGDGSSNCEWSGGEYGCIRFGFDSPIESGNAGAYRLTVKLDVSATYLFSGFPIPIDLVEETLLNYYVLVIDDEQNASASEIFDPQNFSLIGTFPNPANDNFIIKYGNVASENVSIRLYDILGNILLNESHSSVPGYNEVKFDARNLSSGIYTVSVSNREKQMVKRIMIE